VTKLVWTYIVKERVALREIDDVDVHGLHEFAGVLHTEIKPLQAAISVRVVSHEAIVDQARPHPHLIQVG
jgi:hypothetical protein